MSTQRSQTITLADPTVAAMTADAVALTDVLTRTTNTRNPAAIERITSILDRLITSHRSLMSAQSLSRADLGTPSQRVG